MPRLYGVRERTHEEAAQTNVADSERFDHPPTLFLARKGVLRESTGDTPVPPAERVSPSALTWRDFFNKKGPLLCRAGL
jgi:hypothetical protein